VALLNDGAPFGVVNAGDRLRYTLVASNGGTTALVGVTLVDPIPGGLTYVVGSASPAASWDGTRLTWSNQNLPVGASLTFTFDVDIQPFPQQEREFSNQASASSAQTGSVLSDANGDPGDGQQPTLISATNGAGVPRLDLQKHWSLAGNLVGGNEVDPGDILLYTLILSNQGSAPATDVRVVNDPLPVQVTLVEGSILTSRGNLVSQYPIQVNVGTLNPGELATISFQVRVNPNTGGQLASNQARVNGYGLPGVWSDNDGNPGNGLNPTLTPIVAPVAVPTLTLGIPALLAALLALLAWSRRAWVSRTASN